MIGAEFDSRPCPHCGAQARLVRHPKFLWACGACGAPRIPSGVFTSGAFEQGASSGGERLRAASGARSGAIEEGCTRALRTAGEAYRAAMKARISGGVALGASVLLLVVAALVGLLSRSFGLVTAVFALGGGLLAFSLRKRAERSESRAGASVNEAWGIVAADLLGRAGRELSSAELAAALEIDEARAETLLLSLAVHDRIRVDVGDDAALRFASPGRPPPFDEGAAEDVRAVDDAAAPRAKGTERS